MPLYRTNLDIYSGIPPTNWQTSNNALQGSVMHQLAHRSF